MNASPFLSVRYMTIIGNHHMVPKAAPSAHNPKPKAKTRREAGKSR